MAKQYDRLLNPYLQKTKQDITAFDDLLWRLKVALSRVQRIGPYRLALKKRTIDELLEERQKLADSVKKLRDSDISGGKRAVQLGPLREAVYQLEDMADGIEYRRWKAYQEKTLIQRLRLVLKLRKTEKLLNHLQVIIKDFQEFESEKGKTTVTESNVPKDEITEQQFISQGTGCSEVPKDRSTNYGVQQISDRKGLGEISEEKDSGGTSEEKGSSNKFEAQHIIKDQLVEILLQQGGDPVIPFEIAQEANSIPIHDIFDDKKIREEFDLLLHVNASDRPPQQARTLTESILKVMNANGNVQGAFHTQKCAKCRCGTEKMIEEDMPLDEEGRRNWSEGEEVKELEEKFSGKGKKFLLVLEDVLEDQLPQLDRLLSALLCRKSGNRIVITSQISEVVQSVRGVKFSNDGDIQHDIHQNFFRCFAFRDAKKGEDENENEVMNRTAKEMSDHLKCFPLAAKMVGKMLNNNRDPKFWIAILGKLRREVKIECAHCQLLSLLKICYDELPAPLRLCFQYCSLFPIDWTFTRENLIQLWMSQGFLVEDSHKGDPVEFVGRRYCNELFLRSFFEELINDSHTCIYRLHASVHCLAQVTAGEEFMRLESDIKPEESLCARHLSVVSTNLSALHNVDALFRLRSLIIFGSISSDPCQTLNHILPRLKNTRTLDLAGCNLNKFPELSNDLRKHLRFLSIYDTDIYELPDDFCEFFHLQVLNVQGSRVMELPPRMAKLCNLRHISGPTFITSAVSHIGKLSDLQELEEFAVSKKNKIHELGGIKYLGGSISITNLERVIMFMHATKARLHEKTSLNSLKLEWSNKVMHRSRIFGMNKVRRCLSAKVLERLKPSSDIHTLEINRYIGGKSPRWFTTDVLLKIETITLTNCVNLVEPPTLGQLPHLKTLKMGNWKKLKCFPQKEDLGCPGFLKLIDLSLEDMPELEAWADHDESFPCLELLTIRHCPKLEKIPLLKSKELKEIHVVEVGLKDLPLWINEQVDTSTSSQTTPESLKRLTIQQCQGLSTVGGYHDDARYLPSTLLHLRITGCKNIECISFKAPVSLQELHIDQCEKLTVINSAKGDLTSLRAIHLDNISLLTPHYEHLMCLEELVIEGEIHGSLDKLPKNRLRKLCLNRCHDESFFKDKTRPNDMVDFMSLKCLYLKQCNKLSSLPHLPYNLDELHIYDCPLLEKQYREGGPSWSSISHVPYKYI